MYPSVDIKEELIPKLVELIKGDVLRVQDPKMHSPCQIIAGNNYKDSDKDRVDEAIAEFKKEVHDK
jgi:hypothetical protein